ncbi:cyclin-H1-1-like isoform X3 [Rhododendron vialii]|uniref:cyclin-H1-1-like isoform X3 n=1 Tax=Rhododendron vialii TaxID=182163 RepID=UPI00265ECB82|nr:cyclin-H1-1-like isoform X3 [Rhododendron vialii]
MLLALAALYQANEVHGLIDFERYVGNLLSRQHDTHSISELTVSLNAIISLVSKLVTLTATDMKHVDRKLKLCQDPSSHDKNAVFSMTITAAADGNCYWVGSAEVLGPQCLYRANFLLLKQ